MVKKIAPYSAFLIGPTGKIISWNENCERIFGYASNSILLKQFNHLIAPSDKKTCQATLMGSSKVPDNIEATIIHANGSSAKFNLIFVPHFRKSGRFSGHSVIIGPTTNNELMSETELISRAPLKEMVNFLPSTFYVISQSGYLVMWNKRVETASQLTSEELKKTHFLALFNDEERKFVASKVEEVFKHPGEILVEASLISKNGSSTPFLFSGSRFTKNNKFYLCGMGMDITERRQQDERLLLLERALHASGNGILITRCIGNDNPIEYVNHAFERITGYMANEVIGLDSRFMAIPNLDKKEQAQLLHAINERREINVIFRNRRKNGELFWNDLKVTPVKNEKGVVTHFIGVITDATESMQRTLNLEHEKNHDALTGLVNRNLLWDRLEHAIHIAQRNKTFVATVLIDVDDFKMINDTMGHDGGDEVLKIIAERLKISVRDSDTVARLGGDEFIVILYNQPSLSFIMQMIGRLRQNISKVAIINGKDVFISVSMGISIFPDDGSTSEELVKVADIAMYKVKTSGRNNFQLFSDLIECPIGKKIQLEQSMKHALDHGDMYLVFQPKISMKTNKIVGAEALLRWNHPEKGVLEAASFIHVAEESGLIIAFGEWVLDKICNALQQLKLGGFHNIPLSMNVSFRELYQNNYVSLIEEKLHQANLDPEILELEIHEKYLMRNIELTNKILTDISKLGVKLTIDEFGAELSSLSNLHKLPVSHIKISKSFLECNLSDGEDGVIAKTMIGIGHLMNIEVIAECVETKDQLNFLTLHGCDQIQGNYFSKPICLSEFEGLLSKMSA